VFAAGRRADQERLAELGVALDKPPQRSFALCAFLGVHVGHEQAAASAVDPDVRLRPHPPPPGYRDRIGCRFFEPMRRAGVLAGGVARFAAGAFSL
jgi:hypothetical protein